jgi:hypothetical protein
MKTNASMWFTMQKKKHIETSKYGFPTTIFAKQHAAQHLITQRWVKNSNQLCDF